MDTAGEIYETRRLHGHNEPPMERDDISAMLERDWDELFAMPASDVAAFQLAAARRRFEEMRPRLRALDAQASGAGVTKLDRIEDVVPLLFLDAVYKSYPLALVEKGRFDLLTQWLQAYTTIDLSAVDVSSAVSIDTWLDTLADQTPLRVIHTTGTNGKLSYFPRSSLEIELWSESFVKMLEGFGGESGFRLGKRGERVPVIVPIPRHAKYIGQRNLDYLQTHVAPSPDQLYVLNNGTLSADLLSLAGRIRIAQAKGDVSQVKLTEPMRLAMRNYLEELERRPAEQGEFFRRVVDELGGQRVFISSAGNILLQAAQAGAARGLGRVFSPESAGITGPGGKEPLPADWLDQITHFTGLSTWRMVYGMSELVGLMPGCSYGHYHIPPYYIPFLLDPESGALLPRTGTVTGRFAFLDLLPQTNWGGVVSGDKVTLTFDEPCPCGRSGAYVHNDITRYSAAVTGEDKITCAATVDNTDLALQQLLGL
jgi:hypothetical protein